MKDDLKKCLHPTPILGFLAAILIIGTIGAFEWETITVTRGIIQLAIGAFMIWLAFRFDRGEF